MAAMPACIASRNRLPGLTMLQRGCAVDRDALPDAGIDIPPGPQNLVLVASMPLTNDNRQPLPAGAPAAARNGEVLSTR